MEAIVSWYTWLEQHLHLASDPLQLFDAEIRECFAQATAVPTADLTWQQAQLSLSHGDLGLRSVSHHSLAAYIASLCFSGFGNMEHKHITHAVDIFNSIVSPSEVITVASILASHKQHRALSQKIEDYQFSVLFEASTLADRPVFYLRQLHMLHLGY